MAAKTFPKRSESGTPTTITNGHGGGRQAVSVAPPKGKVRLPELAIGVFVMVSFALGAVLWHLNSVHKVPALATAVAVKRGETIAADDIRIAYVASDDALARLEEGQLRQVVGRVALVDLPAGTLMTRALVGDAATLRRGNGVTGLSLEPGQYPGALAPGDRVSVIRSVDGAAANSAGSVVARKATVVSVADLASDRKLVSIMTSEGDADEVAAAAGGRSLRLVLVSP